MTITEAIYQDNIDKLKAHNLLIHWESESELHPKIDVFIKHISGQILLSDFIDKDRLENWLGDNVVKAICIYKQAFQKELKSGNKPKGMDLVLFTRANLEQDYKKTDWIIKLTHLPHAGHNMIFNDEIYKVDGVTHNLDRKEVNIYLTNE